MSHKVQAPRSIGFDKRKAELARRKDNIMDAITKLIAIEELRSLKARYVRYIDCKLWDELPDIFTKDLKVLTPDGAVHAEGGAVYAASLQESLVTAVSCHQCLTSEIEVLDSVNARAIWAMHDVIAWADRHPRLGWKSIAGWGHYHETYRHEDGRWLIATLTLTRVRLDIVWPDDQPRASHGPPNSTVPTDERGRLPD